MRAGPDFATCCWPTRSTAPPPKTQSALLEAMEERQATVDGTRYPLSATFLVIATQNPVEYEGTYPLPEAQLDRFLVQSARHLRRRRETEGEVLRRYHRGFDPHDLTGAGLQPVLDQCCAAGRPP